LREFDGVHELKVSVEDLWHGTLLSMQVQLYSAVISDCGVQGMRSPAGGV
jgi:hypothetical protein